jgi:hypothetical protein
MFLRVYGLEIQSVMLVFRPSFVNCCPSNLLSGSTLPPPPLPCVNKFIVYIYTVCKEGGGGKGGVYMGFGPQSDKHLPQSSFTGQYESYLFSTTLLKRQFTNINGVGCRDVAYTKNVRGPYMYSSYMVRHRTLFGDSKYTLIKVKYLHGSQD